MRSFLDSGVRVSKPFLCGFRFLSRFSLRFVHSSLIGPFLSTIYEG